MADFTTHPADDRYWFIRHIDGFNKPHLGTTSTSVRCELAPIPAQWEEPPAKLSHSKVSHLFGRRNPECFITTILVGALPAIAVGQVFKRGKYVASLPAVQLPLNDAIHSAEASALFGHANPLHADSEIGTSPTGKPIVLLSDTQLQLSSEARKHSQFLAVRDTSDPDPINHIEFLIPRVVIFRTFYGFTTKMANLFTQGQWDDVVGDAVHKSEFAGNKTGIHQATGAWHIVLALGMAENDDHKTALLYFDKYARAEANHVGNPMLQSIERTQLDGGADAHWHANARLPLNPTGQPYTGKVSGFFLYDRRNSSFKGKIFLVRGIHSLNLPSYMPPVGSILINDNSDGAEVTVVSKPKSWPGRPRTRKRPNRMSNTDSGDGSTRKPAFDMPSMSFEFLPRPERYTLKKDKSTTQTGPRKPGDQQPTTEGSSGNVNGNSDSKSHIRAALERRAPSELFEALIAAMAMLKGKGHIKDSSIIQPSDRHQRVLLGAYECWNFLTEGQHRALQEREIDGKTGVNWPTRSWPYIASGNSPYDAVERAALVLRVDLADGRTGIWIEIEMKKSESYTSALLIHKDGDIRRAVIKGLAVIRKAKGVSMSKHFHAEGLICHCHPHYMEKPEEKSSSKASKTETDQANEVGADSDEGTKKAWSAGPLIAFLNELPET